MSPTTHVLLIATVLALGWCCASNNGVMAMSYPRRASLSDPASAWLAAADTNLPSTAGAAAPPATPATPPVPQQQQQQQSLRLTLFEDFTGSTLNTTRWNVRNNESHCCPAEPELYLADEVYLEDGCLVLRTRLRNATGPHGEAYKYTSGWVDTKEKWFQRYGRFEVHAALPARNETGTWPAHWLMPNPSTASPPNVCWPVGGEIDIMEYTANPLINPIYGSYRWGTKCGDNKQVLPGSVYPPLGAPAVDWTQFHTFAVQWNETALVFSVDGHNYHTKTAAEVTIPQDPFYIILDSAIAWYWMPQGDTFSVPALHRIDWIKVYALE